MNICDISRIPPLNYDSFVAILQSFVRFEGSKESMLPPSHTEHAVFMEKTWQELGYNAEVFQGVVNNYAKMFSVTLTDISIDTPFKNVAQQAFELWSQSEQTVTFFTSGSTGIPKPCVHHEADLRQELISIVARIPKAERAIITVPLHHLYGFTFGLLLPLALKVPVTYAVPFPPVIADLLKPYDVLVAPPLLYNHLAELESLNGENISCISGTAPLAEGTFDTLLHNKFNFIENFGSSELGVIGSRQNPHDAFTLLPHFARVDQNTLIRTLPDHTTIECSLQDNIDWLDEKLFTPKGRKDHAVQIGGHNVFPSHVQAILEKHPMIKQCAVRLMRKDEGSRLKAFIVLCGEVAEKDFRADLTTFMHTHLSNVERPTSITIGDSLPTNSLGKVIDW